jgi:hypothetical protein
LRVYSNVALEPQNHMNLNSLHDCAELRLGTFLLEPYVLVPGAIARHALQMSVVDGVMPITTAQAMETARDVALKDGLLVCTIFSVWRTCQ